MVENPNGYYYHLKLYVKSKVRVVSEYDAVNVIEPYTIIVTISLNLN